METIRKEALLFVVLLITLLTPLVSAEISIGPVKSLYNSEDNFSVVITIRSAGDIGSFFSATIVCGASEIELFKGPYTLSAGGEKEIVIETILGDFLIGEVQGECYLRTEYGGEQVLSQKFAITSAIDVLLNIEGIVFSPGDQVNVYGEAIKNSGELLNGFVEISVLQIDYATSGVVSNGKFDFNFTIPENVHAGSYEIEAHAYEKDNGGKIINEGNAKNIIRIKQVPQKIDIALSSQTVAPGSDFSYTVLLYDQAGDIVAEKIGVVITEPDGSVFEKKIVSVQEIQTIHIESNHSPGYWTVESKLNEQLIEKITFLVEEYRDLAFKLDNYTLIIENIGNVPFTGPVEISIGGINELKDITDLPVGVAKKFKLLAPDGEYDIEVSDGFSKENLGTTFLTGKAISVQDNVTSSFLRSRSTIVLVWLLVIVVLVIIVLFLYRKISKRRIIGKTPRTIVSKNIREPMSAQGRVQSPSLIDRGEKQEVTIVSLHLKNAEQIATAKLTALKTLDSVLWKAKEASAKVYTDGDFRIIVLAPVLTKEKDNSIRALDIAKTIERMLNEHNRRMKPRIDFGIGVNTGNLIVESKAGKFKFVSVDNTIAATKRISQQASDDIVISEPLHRKTVGKTKTQKLVNQNLWRLEKITDRSQHKDFLRNMADKYTDEHSRANKDQF